MNTPLPAPISRLAAVLLLALVLAVLWLGVAKPVADAVGDTRLALAEAESRKRRLEQAIEENRRIASGSIDVSGYSGDFLQGESDAVIIAEIQKQIGAIVQANASELTTAQPLPARQDGGHTKLGVRVQLRGSLDRVQTVLHMIESARPYLFIHRTVLRVDASPRPGAPTTGIGAVQLTAELDVIGMRLLPRAKQGRR